MKFEMNIEEVIKQVKDAIKVFALAIFMVLGACSEQAVLVDTAIENVTVFSGRGEKPFVATVGIRDGAIVGISVQGETIFKAEHRIDGTKKFLVPGLWDTHVHMHSSDERGPGLPAEAFIKVGITSVHDLGSYPDRLKELENQIAGGAITGPTVYPAYFMLNGESFAGFQHEVTNEAQVISAIEELVKLGAVQVKIHRALPPDLLPIVVTYAHEAGLTVTGHVPLGMHPLDACEAGMDGIQHIVSLIEALISVAPEGEDKAAAAYEYLLSDASLPLYNCLRDRGVTITPTLIPYHLRVQRLAGDGERSQPMIDFLNSLAAVTKRLYEEGVIILAGTDTTDLNLTGDLPYVPGTLLLDELLLLEKAGIPASSLIPIATLNAAESIGVETKTGSIELGKIADLVLLSSDPAQSATSFSYVEIVFKAGKIIFKK